MAVIISGKSRCPLCNELVKDVHELMLFPPFVQNIKDPFYLFNDVGVHKACLDKHLLREKALKYLNLFVFKTRPENRFCDIGGNKIKSPDDYMFITLLSSDDYEKISQFNFMTIDKNNIRKWSKKNDFIEAVQNFIQNDKWQNLTPKNYLEYLINEIREKE